MTHYNEIVLYAKLLGYYTVMSKTLTDARCFVI